MNQFIMHTRQYYSTGIGITIGITDRNGLNCPRIADRIKNS